MPEIRYKITDKDMRTYNGFQWELDKWVKTSGEGALCTNGWIHVYCSPLLAVLHNPIHGNYSNIRLFECEVAGKTLKDGEMKEGWSEVRLTKEIAVPVFTTEKRVEYGIRCASEVYHNKLFLRWATVWLNNIDRSAGAAEAAGAAAWTTEAAVWAAESAARTAEAAAEAALAAARAAWAAGAATWAAWAAEAAAWVAEAEVGDKFSLLQIAKELSKRGE